MNQTRKGWNDQSDVVSNYSMKHDVQNSSILICANTCLCNALEVSHEQYLAGGLRRGAETEISTLSVTHCGHLKLNVGQE